MEEWEKVDVGEVRAPGGGKSLSSPTTSKNEVTTSDFQHTTTREAHRDACYCTESSGEGTIDAPLWKYYGTQEDDVSWRSEGAQGVPHRDISSLPKSSWEAVGSFDAPSWKCTGTNKTIHLGDLREHNCPRQRGPFALFTRSNMARFPEGLFCRFFTVISYLVMRRMSRLGKV